MVKITKGIQPCYARVVLYGVEGIGKTSIASKLPNPLIIDIERGSMQLDVARTEPTSYSEIVQIIEEIKNDQQGFKTLVIDTADWLEALICKHVVDGGGEKINSIEDFGYGKGFVKVEETWRRFLDLLNLLPMDVIMLAHSDLKKFELPDEQGSYDRYALKLSKKGSSVVKEWPNDLLFANFKTIVTIDENEKAKASGRKRVLYTTHHASWDAKNRNGLAEELPLDVKSIIKCFGQMEGKSKPAATEPQGKVGELKRLMDASKVTPDMIEKFLASKGVVPAGTSYLNFNDGNLTKLTTEWSRISKDIIAMSKTPDENEKALSAAPQEKTPEPTELEKLMARDGITIEQLEKEVASKGISGSYKDFPESVNQRLINGWEYVVKAIKGA